jgi:outer membrane lipoprotein-sorting protein
MFKPTALLLAIASCAWAQTPQELLRLAQDTYKNPDGYEIEEVMHVHVGDQR